MDEKEGFSFGKVFRLDEDGVVAILPILRESKTERGYVVLPEAPSVKIEDTGGIDAVKVTNNGSLPVYIRSGTVLKGQTQERAAVIGRIVFPNETETIKIVCVHQTRPIAMGSKMVYHSLAPASIDLTSQHLAWNCVASYSGRAQSAFRGLNRPVPTGPFDDLASYAKSYSSEVEKVLPKIEHKKNQAGMVMFDVEGVYIIEIFDLEPSWKALRDDVIK